MSEPAYIQAHKHSIRHRDEITTSDKCGCFYCLAIFSPDELDDWVDEENGVPQTALCCKCGIDSVIGSASGFPITCEFLALMKAHWFDKSYRLASDGTVEEITE